MNTGATTTYISYPKAIRILKEKLKATPADLAGWIWAGPDDGGLAAYTNANEFDGSWENSPPRFFFTHEDGPDYLSLQPQCWFSVEDISAFEPSRRFITGEQLRLRWTEQLGEQADAFVSAKIRESRLMDFHPTMNGTQWSENEDYPPKESALFVLADVEAIEEQDGITPGLSDEHSLPEEKKTQQTAHEETQRQRDRRLSVALQKKVDAEIKGPLTRLAEEEGITRQTLMEQIERHEVRAYLSLIEMDVAGDPDPLTHLAGEEGIPKLTLAGILKRCGKRLVDSLKREEAKSAFHLLASLAQKKGISFRQLSNIIEHHRKNHPTR